MSAPALALVPRRISLFELVADVENIADLVDALDRDGELTPELANELQRSLFAAISGTKLKVDRTAGVLHMMESAEASAAAEIERLKKRVETFRRQRERLSDYVLAVLDVAKVNRIDGETSSLSRRKNPAKVVIDDANRIPEEFFRLPEPPPPPSAVPDKAALKRALQCGPVDGCRLLQDFRLVRS